MTNPPPPALPHPHHKYNWLVQVSFHTSAHPILVPVNSESVLVKLAPGQFTLHRRMGPKKGFVVFHRPLRDEMHNNVCTNEVCRVRSTYTYIHARYFYYSYFFYKHAHCSVRDCFFWIWVLGSFGPLSNFVCVRTG